MGHHCGNYVAPPLSRRQMLRSCASGFGAVALAGMLGEESIAKSLLHGQELGITHHAPRARNVIFLYMDGGPSQVDTFDPKPRLTRENGQPFGMEMERTQFNNNGKTLQSPWKFKQHGQSGHWVSDLFPHVATCADDLCIVRSMVSEFSEHTNANYFLHTGQGIAGRPSMGSWVSYGLGSLNRNLPGFVVLNGGLVPPGGLSCFSNGFLPARFQGSLFKPDDEGVSNIRPLESPHQQRRKLDLVDSLDSRASRGYGNPDELESAIANAELAFNMQWSVPEVLEITRESVATRQLYGLDSPHAQTRIFARQCLLARRLVEQGVRFVELTCPDVGTDRWDQHNNIKDGHTANALGVDQPIAGLLKDLKARGMLDETLVVWAAEFGRTPFAQGGNGRDHNPFGYTIWMAGGGTRAGSVHGATDEYGYKAVDKPVEVHDLHATMLHLLGVNHKELTVDFGGRAMRLTDVKGHVVEPLLA